MKYQPGLLDPFISPVSGKLRSDVLLPPIEEDYVWIGDRNANALASPVIIDVRLDVIELRTILDKITPSPFILQTKNDILPYAQALDELEDGILKHSKGVIEIAVAGTDYMLPILSKGKLWIGDDDNKPVEKSRIELENLPSFSNTEPTKLLGAYNLYTGSASPTSLGDPETTLHLQRCNLPDLTVGYLWIGKKVSAFEDPLNFGDNRPTEIKELPLDNMANLSTDKIWVGDSNNRPIESDKIPSGGLPDLSTGRFWMGDGNNRPQDTGLLYKNLIIGTEDDQLGFREKIYDDNLPDLTIGRFWMGDGNNRPQDTGLSYKNIIIGTQDDQLGFRATIYIDNLPNLTFKKIWRGDATGRPIESNDLTILEGKVTNIEDVVIPGIEEEIAALESEIAALESEIVAIQAEITSIQAEVTGLSAAVVILQGQILVIQGQIAALNTRIDNLKLNNIPADGDVSFYDFKLINLKDPTNPTDGVNLRTLVSYIDNVPTAIELTGDVTGLGNTGTPVVTTLELTLDQIKIAQNSVNLNNQKIINLKSDQVEQQDALNANFLWDLMHDNVGVVWA